MGRGRIGKQCRERWFNHLRPDITNAVWCVRYGGPGFEESNF